MASLNEVNGAGICPSVGCDEQARLYDLENRFQIPAEAEILSAVFRLSLGPAQPPVRVGYRVSFQRAKAAGA